MILIDLVKTVYLDLKKRKIMSEKLAIDANIRALQAKKKDLQARYDDLNNLDLIKDFGE